MTLSRYVDVIVLAIGAAVAIPLGAPVGGYAIGAGTWLLQRLVAGLDAHLIAKITAPVKHLGYSLFEAFGRVWLLAGGIIVAIVVGHRAWGLTAALIIVVAYSVNFVVRVASGPPQGRPAR